MFLILSLNLTLIFGIWGCTSMSSLLSCPYTTEFFSAILLLSRGPRTDSISLPWTLGIGSLEDESRKLTVKLRDWRLSKPRDFGTRRKSTWNEHSKIYMIVPKGETQKQVWNSNKCELKLRYIDLESMGIQECCIVVYPLTHQDSKKLTNHI